MGTVAQLVILVVKSSFLCMLLLSCVVSGITKGRGRKPVPQPGLQPQ